MKTASPFRTYEVLINGEKKKFRATSEENAIRNAELHCKMNNIKNANIEVVSIAP